MTRGLLRNLLLVPQPPLTLAYVIAVATYQHPPVQAPVVALGLLPAIAVAAELASGRDRALWRLALGVLEIAWAAGAIALIRWVTTRLGG